MGSTFVNLVDHHFVWMLLILTVSTFRHYLEKVIVGQNIQCSFDDVVVVVDMLKG